jgi:hypothetical protein
MILGWSFTQHHLSVLPDTLRHVIRRTDGFTTVFAILIKSGRGQVTVEAIQKTFQQIAAEFENVPAGFILNAHESRFQDFVDAREVQGIVPATFEYDLISIPGN